MIEHHRLAAHRLQAIGQARRDIEHPALGQDLGLLAVDGDLDLAAIDPAPGAVVGIEQALALVARRHLDIAAVKIAGQQHLLFPARLPRVRLQDIGDMPDRLVDAVVGRFGILVRRPDHPHGPFHAGIGSGRLGPPVGHGRGRRRCRGRLRPGRAGGQKQGEKGGGGSGRFHRGISLCCGSAKTYTILEFADRHLVTGPCNPEMPVLPPKTAKITLLTQFRAWNFARHLSRPRPDRL